MCSSDLVKAKMDALEKAAQAASQAMYSQPSNEEDIDDGKNNKNDDVVDAEFTEK